MARDLASIVLEGGRSRLASIAQGGAYRRERTQRQDEGLGNAMSALIEIPSLVKQKQEEDEIRDVENAFTAEMLRSGDPDSALKATSMVSQGLKSKGGVSAALRLALQGDTMKRNRIASQQQAQLLKQQQEGYDLAGQQRKAWASAFSQVPDGGLAPMGAMPGGLPGQPMMVPTLRDPTAREAMMKYGRSGVGGAPEMRGLALAALTDERVKSVAEENRAATTENKRLDRATREHAIDAGLEKARMADKTKMFGINVASLDRQDATTQRKLTAQDKLKADEDYHEQVIALKQDELDFRERAKQLDAEIASGRMQDGDIRTLINDYRSTWAQAERSKEMARRSGASKDVLDAYETQIDDLATALDEAGFKLQRRMQTTYELPESQKEQGIRITREKATLDAFRSRLDGEALSDFDALPPGEQLKLMGGGKK